MNIKWTKVAQRDLDHIMVHISKDSLETAWTVINRIDQKAKILELHPWVGKEGRKPGTRELVLAGLPYSLIYKINPKWITILRVLHQARQWPPSDLHE